LYFPTQAVPTLENKHTHYVCNATDWKCVFVHANDNKKSLLSCVSYPVCVHACVYAARLHGWRFIINVHW